MMELAGGLVVDAGRKGSKARLINSSCAPNCQAQKWTDAATGEFRVGIFALRDIGSGEELTYDYMFQHAGIADMAESYRCMCGAPNCRGTMDSNPGRLKDRGRRLEVYSIAFHKVYRATVVGFNTSNGRHAIKYDVGGGLDRLDLTDVPHRWLPDASPLLTEALPLEACGGEEGGWSRPCATAPRLPQWDKLLAVPAPLGAPMGDPALTDGSGAVRGEGHGPMDVDADPGHGAAAAGGTLNPMRRIPKRSRDAEGAKPGASTGAGPTAVAVGEPPAGADAPTTGGELQTPTLQPPQQQQAPGQGLVSGVVAAAAAMTHALATGQAGPGARPGQAPGAGALPGVETAPVPGVGADAASKAVGELASAPAEPPKHKSSEPGRPSLPKSKAGKQGKRGTRHGDVQEHKPSLGPHAFKVRMVDPGGAVTLQVLLAALVRAPLASVQQQLAGRTIMPPTFAPEAAGAMARFQSAPAAAAGSAQVPPEHA